MAEIDLSLALLKVARSSPASKGGASDRAVQCASEIKSNIGVYIRESFAYAAFGFN